MRPHSLRAEKTHEVITTCHLRLNQSSHIQTLTLEPEIFISLSRKSRALITGRQHSANTNIASKLLQTNACLVDETSKTPIGAAHSSDILQTPSNLCKQPRAAMIGASQSSREKALPSSTAYCGPFTDTTDTEPCYHR